MPDVDFFERLMSEFSQHHALAIENAGRDAEAERYISTAEYELAQAHRALAKVLHAMQAPAREAIAAPEAPVAECEAIAAEGSVAA